MTVIVLTMTNTERSTDTPEDAGLPPPQWYNVFFAEPGDAVGKLLMSTEVVWQEPPPLGGATREAVGAAGTVGGLQKAMVCRNVGLALPENLPDTVRKYVELTVLGVRGLKPYKLLPIYLPYVEFEVGGQKLVVDANGGGVGGGKGKDRGVYKTRKSKDPTGPEANFLGEIKTQY